MSSAKQGLRRASIGGLSAAVGATVMFGLAVAPANAAAPTAAGDLTADSQPNLTVGVPDQPAGDLHYRFTNTYGTGTQVTFTVADADGNNCAAAADQGIEFNALPTITVTPVTDGTTAPSHTATLGYSDPTCKTVGIADQITVTLNGGQPASDTHDYVINVSNVDYNVGAKAAVGDDVVTADQSTAGTSTATDTDSNGTVVNKSFTFIPLKSAKPSSNGNDLGTATFKEASAGAYFQNAANSVTQVDLALDGGATFTPEVTPTITASGGYTVYKTAAGAAAGTDKGAPATSGTAAAGGSATYTFYLKAGATDAGPATVTVSGLDADVTGTVQVVNITPATGAVGAVTIGSPSKALNVVEQTRTGGSNRYATAAKVFEDGIAAGNFTTPTSVVLSGGQKFPDALSANYLGSEIGTGTLLTKQDELPVLTKAAIIDNGIDTVYITGETAAVSQGVEDEIAAMHVSNNPSNALIQVIRLGGANRYETNATVNRSHLAANDTAVLAAGTAPYDSLAVGPVVYANNFPLVLTRGSKLNSGEEGQFQDFGVQNVVIVGGPSVVSQGIQDQLVSDGYNVTRVSGTTRYATATAIATWATVGQDLNGDGDFSDANEIAAPAQALSSTTTNIANGQAFPDALSDGPVAGSSNQPIVLSKGATDVGPALVTYLNGKTVGTDIAELHALGLTAATSNSMLADAAAAIGNK